MAKERILIAVKTYPTLSEKYIELACTAGFREDGSWVRLYPVPFRLLDQDKRYQKYQWVEVNVARNSGDPRPESYRVIDTDKIALLQKVGTDRAWEERRRIILQKNKIYTNLREIIGLANANELSLAIFKPAAVKDFVIEDAEPEWPQHKVNAILSSLKQASLFEDQNVDDFKIMPKLPYKFSYRLTDSDGNDSTMMVEDWEIGQLYWTCVKRYDENQVLQKVREKYFDDFVKTKDLYLFLGTTRQWHGRAKNPFVIIGTFHPPFVRQPTLF